MPASGGALAWLRIGDLHMTHAGAQNHRDLGRIVALASAPPPGSLDFALLPGDHDFEPRCLDAFYGALGARRLPYGESVKGYRCLFLDVVSAGAGGPDFRLGEDQLAWAERELGAAQRVGEAAIVLMHTYPADLRAGGERLGRFLARPDALCVDMGHTHYNELANDGGTVFMATRSTGQAEEGPPGFSVAAVDGRVVSWRFRPLDAAWPFVLVTRPADRRLATGTDQAVDAPFTVRAKVLGDAPIEAVEAQVDGGDWSPMAPVPGEVALWEAHLPVPGAAQVRVRARDARGREDEDAAEPAHPGWTLPDRAADGSDRDRVGAWPEKGILDTQLGPNRNGRAW